MVRRGQPKFRDERLADPAKELELAHNELCP